jgi:hypothetical protein
MAFAGLLLATLIAQTPNPAAVDGTVTNQITGQPVKKASVRLVGTTSGKSIGLNANTDAAGRFHFDGVDPGKYSVWADCPGYGSNSGGGYIQLVEEQQVKDVAIRLTPLGMAAGRVFDEDGEPMMSVPVFAFHYVYPPGRKELEQSGFASTDDLGRFQMMDLPPGKYFFEAEVRPSPPLPERTVSTIPEIACPPTYYPNGTSLAQAASLEVKSGVELGGLDFHLKPQAAFHVRGRVTDVAPGDVTNQINLHLDRPGVRWGEQSSAPVQLQAGGTFDTRNVVNGEYPCAQTRCPSITPPPTFPVSSMPRKPRRSNWPPDPSFATSTLRCARRARIPSAVPFRTTTTPK